MQMLILKHTVHSQQLQFSLLITHFESDFCPAQRSRGLYSEMTTVPGTNHLKVIAHNGRTCYIRREIITSLFICEHHLHHEC